MLNHVKALVVISVLAGLVFVFAKPICLRFMSIEDFDRRRKVWFALTCTVFLSPSFWLYALVAVFLLRWAARHDSNRLSLYLLALYAAPHVSIVVSAPGINYLFDMTNARLLALVVLIPLLFEVRRQNKESPSRRLLALDILLLSYCSLQIVLNLPHDNVTSACRRAFMLYLDLVVPYYAFSRCLRDKRLIMDALATFVLVGAILVPIAVFEASRSWLLYAQVGEYWGTPQEFAWLLRAGVLRAQVSMGHSLTLGFYLAMSFGFWLFLQRRVLNKQTLLVCGWLWIGLFAAYSRGPWLIAVFVGFLYLLMSPQALSRVTKALTAAGIAALIISMTPMGERITASLPFVGTVDSENVVYRQRLAETAFALIREKPWFGDLFVLSKMEHLRQGQGIIDIVNGYVLVALFYGIVGVVLVGSFLIFSTGKAFFASRRAPEEEAMMLGKSLVACMLGCLTYIAISGFEHVMWLFAGTCVSYALSTNTAAAPDRSRVARKTTSGRLLAESMSSR